MHILFMMMFITSIGSYQESCGSCSSLNVGSCYLRRGLGLKCSLSNIPLYRHNNKLRVPFNSGKEEFIVVEPQWREQLHYSQVQRWQGVWSNVCREDMEERERSRSGPNYQSNSNSRTWESDKDPVRLCQQGVEAEIGAWGGGVSFGQENWTSSDHLAGMSRIPEDQVLKPRIYDVLPNPADVCMWGKIETPACPLRSSEIHPEALVEGGMTTLSNPLSKQQGDQWQSTHPSYR